MLNKIVNIQMIKHFILIISLFSCLNSFSQNENINKYAELHFRALDFYTYIPDSSNSIIDSLEIIKSSLNGVRKNNLETIIYSLKQLMNGDSDSSLFYCYSLLYGENKLNFDDSLMIHQQIGRILLDVNEQTESKSHILDAMEIVKNHKYNYHGLYYWITSMFRAQNELDSAIYYFKKIQSETEKEVIDFDIKIAMRYIEKENPDSALIYINKCRNNYDEPISKDNKMFIDFAEAEIYKLKGDFNQALKYYKKCILDTTGMINWYPYVNSNLGITEIYFEQQLYDSCSYYMEQFFLCPCLDLNTRASLYDFKAQFYKKLGNHEEYILNLELANKSKDSIISWLNGNILQSSSFGMTHKNMIIDKFRITKERNEANKEKSQAVLGFLTLFVLILALLTFFLIYRNKKKKQVFHMKEELMTSEVNKLKLEEEKLNLEIKSKNIDLSKFATNLTLTREFIEKLSEKLKKLDNLGLEELKTGLKNYIHEFESQKSIDNQLSNIQKEIEKVNSNLFIKLKEKFPALTKNDIQICALHVLGLSTKEISIIRNVTPKSVQVSRYRIKKKMGLEEETNIVDYIRKEFM